MIAVIENIEDDYDRAMVSRWYDEYYNIMCKKAYDILNNYELVKDMVNEAFVRIIRHMDVISRLDNAERALYFMNTIKSVSIDYCRKKNREDTFIEDYHFDGENDNAKQIKDMRLNPEQSYERKEFYRELEIYMEQLSKGDRMIIMCKCLWEMSDKETAAILGIKQQNVHTYLRRAKDRLIKIMNVSNQ